MSRDGDFSGVIFRSGMTSKKRPTGSRVYNPPLPVQIRGHARGNSDVR